MTAVLLTVLGAVLVLAALRDMFTTLWRPGRLGFVCRTTFQLVWRSTSLLGRRGRALGVAGPLATVLTVIVWAMMIVLGWALVYLAYMPEGFHSDPPLPSTRGADSVSALYLSLATVTTLGFGDISPTYFGLRLVLPLESVIGLVLFTTSITWVLELYPALSRRRATARRLTLLAETDAVGIISGGEAGVAAQLLDDLTAALTTIEVDLVQSGEIYFFRESEPDLSFAVAASFLPRLVAAGEASRHPEVRHAASVLGEQTHRLALRLERKYLHTGGGTGDVLRALAADHRQQGLSPG